MTEGKLEFSESESHHREKPKHSTSHDMAAHNCISPVTDAMVERAWAAIVGRDIAPQCFNASIIRGDLRTALEAVISPAQPSTSPGTSYTLRGEIADAIREYCHSVSPAAVQMSHGVERIYYSGISLDGLTDAIFAALGAGFAQTATRGALEEINALISNGDRPTVNERNAFEHFTVLNRLLLNIRDIARRALSSVPSTTRGACHDHPTKR